MTRPGPTGLQREFVVRRDQAISWMGERADIGAGWWILKCGGGWYELWSEKTGSEGAFNSFGRLRYLLDATGAGNCTTCRGKGWYTHAIGPRCRFQRKCTRCGGSGKGKAALRRRFEYARKRDAEEAAASSPLTPGNHELK